MRLAASCRASASWELAGVFEAMKRKCGETSADWVAIANGAKLQLDCVIDE
jgi:hypothetical protein